MDLTRILGSVPEVATVLSDGGPNYLGSITAIPTADNSLKFSSTSWVRTVIAQEIAAALNKGVPVSTVAAFAGTTAPENWMFCNGAAVSRTTYPDLFTAIGTTFGAGDGSTTFNLPDMRGRVAVGLEDATSQRLSITAAGGITSGNASITGLNSVIFRLTVGMSVTGTGIQAGSTISAINVATGTVTMTNTANATNAGASLTFYSFNSRAVGSSGGSGAVALNTFQMPAHTHNGTTNPGGAVTPTGTTALDGAHTHPVKLRSDLQPTGTGEDALNRPVGTGTSINDGMSSAGAHTHAITMDAIPAHTHTFTTSSDGGGNAFGVVQPSLILNYIIKVV